MKYFMLFLSSVLWFSCAPVQAERLVVLVSFYETDQSDAFFYPDPDNYWYQLKQACAKAGYTLTTKRNHDPQDVYAFVAFNAPSSFLALQYPDSKKILYLWEPPTILRGNFDANVHKQYDIVATWHDGMVDEGKFRKFNYALLFHAPLEEKAFEDKKLCCMFVGNKYSSHPDELYSARLSMLNFLGSHAQEDFDLYGSGWSGHPSYKGFARDKVQTMKNYRFAIVYENMKNIPGYITEKIFDAFSAGCVPVYWGASNVGDFIPKECFIARESFASDDDVYAFLKGMSKEEHQVYVDAIARFLSSEQAYAFSREKFIETFVQLLDSN